MGSIPRHSNTTMGTSVPESSLHTQTARLHAPPAQFPPPSATPSSRGWPSRNRSHSSHRPRAEQSGAARSFQGARVGSARVVRARDALHVTDDVDVRLVLSAPGKEHTPTPTPTHIHTHIHTHTHSSSETPCAQPETMQHDMSRTRGARTHHFRMKFAVPLLPAVTTMRSHLS